MAYPGILSLTQILEQILQYDHQYLIPDEEKQIQSLLEKISSLHVFLEKTSQQPSETMECLESRIRDITYKAEDIIESHITDRVLAGSKHDGDESSIIFCRNLKKIIKKINLIKKRLTEVDKNAAQDLQPRISLHADSYQPAPRDKSTVVGLDDDLLDLKTRLIRESSELETVSIVGMGGIGKTTFARNVYEDAYIVYHFHTRAWVTVSQNHTVREILLGILDSMEKLTRKIRKESSEYLREYLYKNLKGRKYLIVMDDVWDTKIWDDVKRLFPNDKNGSRIMLTTRLKNIAAYVSSSFVHRMNFLDKDKSWNLFCEKVFGKDSCPLELVGIGKTIAQNCRGLPLAIVVIGGLLSKASKTEYYWRNVARDVTSVITSNDEQFTKILSLSYNHLPHHLKVCFLYMGIFPEDFDIRVSELVKLWVAEGILKPVRSKSLEEVAHDYLSDLVDRSLILACKHLFDDKIKTCRIHDLLRDMCLREAQRKNIFHVARGSIDCIPQDISVRCASVHIERRSNITYSGLSITRRCASGHIERRSNITYYGLSITRPTLPLRSFLYFNWDTNSKVDVGDLRLLRVLHLAENYSNPLQNEIIELVNLRYLSGTCDYEWPLDLICNLRHLQTLILHGSFHFYRPLHLPPEIWKMSELRHVKLNRVHLPDPYCAGINEENAIVVLENLQTLSIIRNFRFTEQVLQRIPNLKKLGIYYDGTAPDWEYYCLKNLERLHKLEALKCLFSSPPHPSFRKNLTFPHSLKKITLSRSKLPWEYMTVVGSLPNLQVLKLKVNAFHGRKWEPNEGEFPKLKFLLLEEIYLVHWGVDSVHFRSLQRLALKECEFMEEIPCGIGELASLELIELHRCSDSLVTSAKRIQEEQFDFGNDNLQVRVVGFD